MTVRHNDPVICTCGVTSICPRYYRIHITGDVPIAVDAYGGAFSVGDVYRAIKPDVRGQ